MSRSIIGNLRVHLGMDSAQFQAGLTNATKGIDRFAKSAAKIGAAVGAAITATTAVVSMAVRNAINEADNMAKAAQKFGVGVEELTRLKHAADLSGVSVDTLGKGMQRISRNMLDAEMGLKAPQRAFDALGISIKNTDGTMKSSTDIMTEVAERFSKMEDGATKTALAMTLFGRAGAEMIPMLNGGAAGLSEMMAEADQLGIVLDTNTAKAAEAFNDNLTRLGRVKDGLVMKITAELLPSLELLSEQFLAFANDEEAIRGAAEGMVNSFDWIRSTVSEFVVDIQRARAEISGLYEAAMLFSKGEFRAGLDAFSAGQAESERLRQDYADRAEQIASGIIQSQGQIQRRINTAFDEAGTQAGDTLLDAIETSAGKGAGRVRAAIDPMVREAERIFDSTRNSVENYHMQIARLNELLAAGAIDQDTYNRAVLQAQDAFDQAEGAGKKAEGTFQNIGQTIGQSFSSAFQGLIDGSKKVGDVLRDLMSQLTQMLMNQAFKAIFDSGGSGGGLFSGLFKAIGFRANGGSVAAGRPYIVGERGPELMIPGSSGSVMRNAELMRGAGKGESSGGVLQVSLSPDLEARILEQAGSQSIHIVKQSNTAMANYRQNGGN